MYKRGKKDKRGYLQISFKWLFAIIVGAFILFLAIYAAIKIMQIEETVIDAKTGKEIGMLLNPLEMGFESGKLSSLSMPVETRIYNRCHNIGTFGKQLIQVSQKSFNKWTQTNINVGFTNKYIFSEYPVEGKKFYVFSKPFNFPFKVADLIYIIPNEKKYCFINAPENIENEISALNIENILTEDCGEATRVCFSPSARNCDISVNYDIGYIEKISENSNRIYFYDDALMYAAIFSIPETYECQVKRLMKRTETLTLLYKDKANFVSRNGCNSNLNSDLVSLANLASNLYSSGSSVNLNSMIEIVNDIDYKNNIADCKLW